MLFFYPLMTRYRDITETSGAEVENTLIGFPCVLRYGCVLLFLYDYSFTPLCPGYSVFAPLSCHHSWSRLSVCIYSPFIIIFFLFFFFFSYTMAARGKNPSWNCFASCTNGPARAGFSNWKSYRWFWTLNGMYVCTCVIIPFYLNCFWNESSSLRFHVVVMIGRNPCPPLCVDINRKGFGRNIYKLLLTISLLLAVNFTTFSGYVSSLTRGHVTWKMWLLTVWRAGILLNSLPILAQEIWQFRTQVKNEQRERN